MASASFRFGVFSDIQYADCEDGFNYAKTKRRFYRHSLEHMKNAFEAWKAYSDAPHIDAVLNLGDSIDGRCRRLGITKVALDTLESYFTRLSVPIYNVVGNHELYNINRKDILNSFLYRGVTRLLPAEASSQELVFYDFAPLDGFRVVVLDSYDISSIGLDHADSRFLTANSLLRHNNSNEDLNDSRGLKEQQFVQYNGGLGPQQLMWLERVLSRSAEAAEFVIIVCHVPFDLCCSSPFLLMWNFREVSELVRRFAHVVKLVICGHTHDYKTGHDAAGIPHLAMPALLETPSGENATAVVELSPDGLSICGNGGVVSDVRITR